MFNVIGVTANLRSPSGRGDEVKGIEKDGYLS